MFGRRRKDPWAYGRSVPQPFSDGPGQDDAPQGLAGLALVERMPPTAAEALRSIEFSWRETVDFAGRSVTFDTGALREFERLVTRDAPDVVSAWLALPPGAVLDDGRPADSALVEQVELLRGAAQQLAHRVLQPGRDAVAVENVYLQNKYRPDL